MAWGDDVWNWFGDITGANAGNAARDQQSLAKQNQATAANSLTGSANKTGTQFAQESGQAGQALGNQFGQENAALGTQASTQAARTAGMNKGQAALLGSQQAGNLFTQGKQTGQSMGMGAYNTGAGNQVNAASNLGNIGSNQANAGQASSNQAQQQSGSLLSGIGGLLFSDENLKEDVKASPDIDEILARVRPVSYKYKPEAGKGEGEHVGVIAQDLEKTPMKENVVDTPAGKAIDGAKQEGSNLNLIVQLAGRIRDLEAQIGGQNA
jgi:hypothetical protein